MGYDSRRITVPRAEAGRLTHVDVAWFVPPTVFGIGAAVAVMLLRRIAEAQEELGRSTRRLRRLEDGLIPVRVETRRARESIERLSRR